MKLNYITIIVENLEESVQFYSKLAELKIIKKINPPAGEINFLANSEGETMLELAQIDSLDSVEAKSLTLSFKSENLDETYEKAVELNYKPSEIVNQPPKPKYFQLKDPNGLMVEFSE